jgi:hypothetical protein
VAEFPTVLDERGEGGGGGAADPQDAARPFNPPESREVVLQKHRTLDKIRITRHSSNPDVNPPTNGEESNAANVRVTQGTVNIFHHVYQHGGGGNYNSIMETEVKRSRHA